MSSEQTVKDALKAGKTVIGKESVIKAVKNGRLSGIVCPSNCPAVLMKELEYYSRISKVHVSRFKGNSADLGQLCGKPFKIMILGIEK
ncbi:MAG: 50S ribosomal protein L30e [Candidatus Aenigmarchaeota archaeon]|nr:50S ribosomal protein L30e [Candidatus Aenigmarchaeota archaeon]